MEKIKNERFDKIYQLFFNHLKELIIDEDRSKQINAYKSIEFERFEKTDKNFLQKTDNFVYEYCLPQNYISIFKTNLNNLTNDYYLVIPIIKEIEDENIEIEGLTKVENVNPCLKIAICTINKKYLNKNIDENYLIDSVFITDEDKVDFSVLDSLMNEFKVYKINNFDESLSYLSCYQYYGIYLLKNNEVSLCNYDNSDEIERLFENTIELFEKYPKLSEVVFLAITSTKFHHVYLEFYRCIERLFRIPYLLDFKVSTNTQISNEILDIYLENKLSWNPRDKEALLKLFKTIESDLDLPDLIKKLNSVELSSKNENLLEKLSDEIYQRRNQIAHWDRRKQTSSINIESVIVLSLLIDKLYEKYYTEI